MSRTRLRALGGRAMSCPPDPLLLLLDTGELPPELAEGWSAASLRGHVDRCRSCRAALRGWEASLESFRDLDVVDTSAYDDAFFDDLAREVDEAMGRDPDHHNVVPLPTRPRVSPLLRAAAALIVAGLGLWMLRPGPAPESAPEPVAKSAPSDEEALIAEAQALGRAWMDEALTEDPDTLALAAPDALDDEDYPFASSLYDELDELSRDELAALFTRL